MPRKNSGSDDQYQRPDFVRASLDAKALALCDKWIQENESETWLYLDSLVRANWRITFKYDSDNHCTQCSATLWDPKDVNHNVCLISRGSDIYDACLITVYKLCVVFADTDLRQLDASTSRG